MSEEKKEENKPEVAAAEQAAALVPQNTAAVKGALGGGPSKKPEPKKEKPANCASCNKSIRKKQCYYRNGKFFCSKRCWKTTIEKTQAQGQAPQEAK